VSADRPINADVPVEDTPSATSPAEVEKEAQKPGPKTPEAKPKSKPAKPQRQREPVPGALKLIAGTIAVAILFILAAVLGGGGGSKSASTPDGPAPASTPASTDGGGGESAATQTAEQLGYPAFATNNTTRVGGSDAAANAAGVALAAFPSTTPAQRPAAVTLVGEDDWTGALAAAVLMAEPVRAPVLISGDDVPEPTEEALAALDPQGSGASNGAGAFLIGDVASPDLAGKATRVRAGAPAATAAAIAKLRDRLAGSAPDHVVVASADHPDLAMPAAAWAARSGDPVLFAEGAKLPQPTVAALKRHTDVPVYVLGPKTAIPASVLSEIKKIDHRVHRVSGKDAVANAIAFARYADGSFGWNVNDPGHGFVLARSDAPLDAAAAAALSASGTWGPLLLTDSAATLPKALRDYFLDVKPGYTTNPTRAFYNHVWVIGDQEAIDVNQQAEVNELAELAKIGAGQ
jgi:hypothetical protein